MKRTQLAEATGYSISLISQVLNGKKRPSLSAALKIYDLTGERYGPLKNIAATEANIDIARKLAAK